MPELLKVGEIARRTAKTVRAIRYYEELRLLQPETYTKGGFRLFRPDVVERIRMIDQFHALGFSLEEIALIVRAYPKGPTGDDAAKRLKPLLKRSLLALEERMALLDRFRREIVGAMRWVEDCLECREEPEEERCTTCRRGSHGGPPPDLIEAIVK